MPVGGPSLGAQSDPIGSAVEAVIDVGTFVAEPVGAVVEVALIPVEVTLELVGGIMSLFD